MSGHILDKILLQAQYKNLVEFDRGINSTFDMALLCNLDNRYDKIEEVDRNYHKDISVIK